MKQFSLPEPTTIVVLNVNPRSEKHGKAKVPAVDVKCQLTASNLILDQLKPELRHALYTVPAKEGEQEGQAELDGVDPATDTPLLRVTGIDPVHVQDELTGYTATLDLGLGRKSSIVELTSCKVNAFTVDAMQGGSVKVTFRLQAAHIDKRTFGELCVLIDCETSLQLEPSESVQATLGEAA